MTLIAANNEIAEKYNNVKELDAKKGTHVKPGSLSQIIQSVKAMRGELLPPSHPKLSEGESIGKAL